MPLAPQAKAAQVDERDRALDDRRVALKKVIDVWSAAFRRHHLVLCCSHDPDGPQALHDGPVFGFDEKFTHTYDEFLAYSAFDHAMTKPDRDDHGDARPVTRGNQRRVEPPARAAGA